MSFSNIKSFKFLATILIMAVGISTHSACANEQVLGTWQGELLAGTTKVPLVFHLSFDDNKKLKASMDSPKQGATNIPIESVTINKNDVSFNIVAAQATFTGKLDNASNTMTGKWQQAGQSFPLTLIKLRDEITGLWKGNLKETPVELSIEIVTDANNNTTAFLSPNDGISKVAVSNLVVNQGKVIFEVPAEGVKYHGEIDAGSKTINGIFSQGNRDFILNFNKQKALTQKTTLNRPQHPSAPYNYDIEEFTFNNTQANIKLAGTLTTPKTAGLHPAVVLISGSGAQDRDQTFMGHKTFLVLADHLTKAGIAVLRFDDRGFGDSEGDFAAATSLDFASDVKAAVDFLKSQKNISADHIGLIGHSEGGLIAPIVANQSKDVSFIALLAGPGISGNEIAIAQIKTILSVNGLSESASLAGSDITRQLNHTVINNKHSKELPILLAQSYQKAWDLLTESNQNELKKIGGGSISQARIAQLSSPWNQYFLSHQPEEFLSSLLIPVLALHGSKDMQMNASKNLNGIKKALKSSPYNKVVELDGLNHLFQTAETGLMSEYAKITETISPKALTTLTEWIISVTKK